MRGSLIVCCSIVAGAMAGVAQAGTFKTLYAFQGGADGEFPSQGLVAVGEKLFGTTLAGTVNGDGAVFSVHTKSGAETVVYSFNGINDAGEPTGTLVQAGNKLYGTAEYGIGTGCGGYGCGAVYSIDPKTGAESVMYGFQGGNDGIYPYAGLLYDGTTLYGTTVNGGGSSNCTGGCGTVFALKPKSGAERVLYAFIGMGSGGADGANPYGSVIKAGSKLFGSTLVGGAKNAGTLYSVNQKTGAESVLFSFGSNNSGANPSPALINVGGLLYGTARADQGTDQGTLFSLDPKTGTEATVYAFKGGSDGSGPEGGVVNVNGVLYGTTAAGGVNGAGTVFSFNLKTGKEKVEYSFTGEDSGDGPISGLTAVNGVLYGTAELGGAPVAACGMGCGTVFSYKP